MDFNGWFASGGRLSRVLTRAAIAVALAGIFNAAFLVWYLERTEAHEAAIFLLGRQRRLAEELVDLALIESAARGAFDQVLDRNIETFEAHQTELLEGVDDVPAAPEAIRPEVEALQKEWNELRRLLRARDQTSASSPSGALRLETIRSLAGHITTILDGALDRIETSRRTYRTSLIALACFTSIFFLSISLLGVRFVRNALVMPARLLQGLSQGRKQTTPPESLDLPADHELEGVAHAVTTLSASLERVRTELDEAQSDYRAIFDNSLAGIYQIDSAGRIILANPAFARMLGFESEDELRSSVRNAHREVFIDRAHRERFFEPTGDDRLENVETRVRTKDGRTLWILESSRRIRKDGELVYCEGIVFDITPRKKATLALRRLSAQLMEVQDEERRRLARELHDSMGQLLAAIEMNLSRLEDTAKLDPSALTLLEDSLELCREASTQTRSTSHLLHPPLLEELGLEHAVREFASGYEKRSGIDVTVEVGNLGRLPQTLETSLFRFVQEGLTNVHRHSGSDRAMIRLFRGDGAIVAEVEDFGKGMPEEVLGHGEESPAMGVGLRGLRARLEQLNGHLDIRSSSSGTIVSAVVPLDDESDSRNRESESIHSTSG